MVEENSTHIAEKPKTVMWRCLKDIWGYCSGEPEVEEITEVVSGDIKVMDKTCKLDPKTCGKFELISEQVDISKIPAPNLVETITAPAGKLIKKEKKKVTDKQEERLF